MEYHVGVAKGPYGFEATVFDLCGCTTQAPDMGTIGELLPVAIAEHNSWLRRHGEEIQAASGLAVIEQVDPAALDAADGEFCFRDDRQPATPADVERAIRAMSYARRDLLELVEPLAGAALDWRPPLSAMAKVDPWNPRVRTIREILREIAGAEGYYRTGLGEDAAPLGDEARADLDRQRERTLERLRSLRDEERSLVFQIKRSWQDGPEHWTARKVLRRIISHERFHTAEVRQRLGWLLLGVPEFETSRERAGVEGAAANG